MSLVIIHLTDIHMCEHALNNPILRKMDALKRACNSRVNVGDDVILAVTGDLAFSGKAKEYELCLELLSSICDFVEQQTKIKVHVAIVPGNHDCDFSEYQDVRNQLIKGINPESDSVSEQIVSQIANVQQHFQSFAELFDKQEKRSLIVNTQELKLSIGNILIVLYNSSWKSELKERPATLCMPINLIPQIDLSSYDLVISLMHHPAGWLHPNNSSEFCNHLRLSTDLILYGHEHRRDAVTSFGETWSYTQKNGSEIQNTSNPIDSSFSIYIINNNIQSIDTLVFSWNNEEGIYGCSKPIENVFTRNQSFYQKGFFPNNSMRKKINDFGILIHHFRVDTVRLMDLFCWPDIELLNYDNDKIQSSIVIQDTIPKCIEKYRLPLFIGYPHCGKTSLAKVLYGDFIAKGQCCIYSEGCDFTSHNPENVWTIIEKLFFDQYDSDKIERFRQLPIEERTLIIDDFEKIVFANEKRDKILGFLLSKFKQVIMLSGTDANLSLLLVMSEIGDNEKITPFRILPFNNIKRRELIGKWYRLGDDGCEQEEILEQKIDIAMQTITTLLGKTKIMPATPIHVIIALQNIGSSGSLTGSKYGYLYAELINRSLSLVSSKIDTGTFNVYVSVLSQIAFSMLLSNSLSFTSSDIENAVRVFNDLKKIEINYTDLLEKLTMIRILHIDRYCKYRFRYPYIFYYFVGLYIANHINDQNVKNQIEKMSANLNVEAYGNIMIFVCHFSNNIEVIDNVLLSAYCLFDKVPMFDITNPNPMHLFSYKTLENLLIPKTIGEEKDVDDNKSKALRSQDAAGINDGNLIEQSSEKIKDDDDNLENDIADLVCGYKTIDVLGQIVRNYPGDINGDRKLDIISEIHNLGMRIITTIMNAIGESEEDVIKFLANQAREKNKGALDVEIVAAVKEMFGYFQACMVSGMISHLARSIGSEQLLPAAKEVFDSLGAVSGKLVQYHLIFNCLRKTHVDEVISYYTHLCTDNYSFAATILKLSISQYLNYNKCGSAIRDKLSEAFSLPKNQLLIASERNE